MQMQMQYELDIKKNIMKKINMQIYKIDVVVKGLEMWTIYRRYSQFRLLYTMWKSRQHELPPFPSKSILMNKNGNLQRKEKEGINKKK